MSTVKGKKNITGWVFTSLLILMYPVKGYTQLKGLCFFFKEAMAVETLADHLLSPEKNTVQPHNSPAEGIARKMYLMSSIQMSMTT